MEGTKFGYQVIYSRRKTVVIQIRNAEVIVRCPYGTKDSIIEEFVKSKSLWVQKNLEEQYRASRLPKYTEAQIAELKAAAKIDLRQRVEKYAPIVGVSYSKISIRHQKSRWGSCSSKGSLSFNCLLMLAPEAVRDYVVVHELCHRRQMNHSAVFWAEVARVLPEYKQSRQWLKNSGKQIIR